MSDQVINAPVSGGSNIELPQPGQHLLYCYSIILLGEIPGYMDQLKNKILFVFEMPMQKATFIEEKGPQPFAVHAEFTHSMHKQSNMRPFVQNWAGKKLNDADAANFNIAGLLEIPALANIIHTTSKNGKEYMDISSIAPAYGINQLPARTNEILIWTWNGAFDQEKFLKIPLWIRNKMIHSTQFHNLGLQQLPMLPGETWDSQNQKVIKQQNQAQQSSQGQMTTPQSPGHGSNMSSPGGVQAPQPPSNVPNPNTPNPNPPQPSNPGIPGGSPSGGSEDQNPFLGGGENNDGGFKIPQ